MNFSSDDLLAVHQNVASAFTDAAARAGLPDGTHALNIGRATSIDRTVAGALIPLAPSVESDVTLGPGSSGYRLVTRAWHKAWVAELCDALSDTVVYRAAITDGGHDEARMAGVWIWNALCLHEKRHSMECVHHMLNYISDLVAQGLAEATPAEAVNVTGYTQDVHAGFGYVQLQPKTPRNAVTEESAYVLLIPMREYRSIDVWVDTRGVVAVFKSSRHTSSFFTTSQLSTRIESIRAAARACVDYILS